MEKSPEIKSTRKDYLEDMLHHVFLLAGNRLTSTERDLFCKVMIQNEIVSKLSPRQMAHFDSAYKKVIHIIVETNNRMRTYDTIYRSIVHQLEESKKESKQLKEKLNFHYKSSPELKNTMNTHISETKLSARVKNVCLTGKIYRVSGLAALTRKEFIKLKNCGEKSAKEVDGFFSENSIFWGMQL